MSGGSCTNRYRNPDRLKRHSRLAPPCLVQHGASASPALRAAGPMSTSVTSHLVAYGSASA